MLITPSNLTVKKESDGMKTKVFTAIMLTAFLSSMLSMAFVTPAIAKKPVISKVDRLKGVCWFHLMTGYYPNGVSVGSGYGEPTYYDEEGYLALTYRNLSPLYQVINLTIITPASSLGANYVFHRWPERRAYDITEWALQKEILPDDTEIASVIWGVPTDEEDLMQDLWFIGWNAGEEIHVTLEYAWMSAPDEWISVYDDYMTIMPLRP
jgi:hypothetical protein